MFIVLYVRAEHMCALVGWRVLVGVQFTISLSFDIARKHRITQSYILAEAKEQCAAVKCLYTPNAKRHFFSTVSFSRGLHNSSYSCSAHV